MAAWATADIMPRPPCTLNAHARRRHCHGCLVRRGRLSPLTPAAGLQDLIPASAANTTLVNTPGAHFRGVSVAEGFSNIVPLRIPSIYNPFTAGHRFVVQQPNGGVSALFFSNVTLVVPNATYATLSTSGLRSFLVNTQGTRFCFSNTCAPPLPALMKCVLVCCDHIFSLSLCAAPSPP